MKTKELLLLKKVNEAPQTSQNRGPWFSAWQPLPAGFAPGSNPGSYRKRPVQGKESGKQR
jgi:hypothetical protein